MKINLSASVFTILMFAAFNASAQNVTRISREVACSVNDGYAMSDVVEFARNIDWPVASAVAIVLLLLLVLPMAVYQHYQAKAAEVK